MSFVDIAISSQILDEYGSPLMGAHIFVKGKPFLNAVSDENGYFSIIGIQPNDIIVISYLTNEVQYVVTEISDTVTINSGLTNEEVVITANSKSNFSLWIWLPIAYLFYVIFKKQLR